MKQERLAVLHSELKRCQAQLAANAGDESFLTYILGDHPEDISYVEDLKSRLAWVVGFLPFFISKFKSRFISSAEARADALDKSFGKYGEEHPDAVKHAKAEAEVRQQLAHAASQLQKYEAIYGNSSTLPPDLQKLEAQLRLKSDEIEELKLKDFQRNEASDASLFLARKAGSDCLCILGRGFVVFGVG